MSCNLNLKWTENFLNKNNRFINTPSIYMTHFLCMYSHRNHIRLKSSEFKYCFGIQFQSRLSVWAMKPIDWFKVETLKENYDTWIAKEVHKNVLICYFPLTFFSSPVKACQQLDKKWERYVTHLKQISREKNRDWP